MKLKLTVFLAAVVFAVGLVPGTSAVIVASLLNVAAEGDELPDGTVLETILLDGGVAINLDGQVAFGGRDGGGIDAVFTQAGKVVAEADMIGGTKLAAFRGQGEVGISAGPLADLVAFHGMAETGPNDTAAVFTQAKMVAAVGDELELGITLDDIDPEGKVAINNWNEVAFHGSVEIASDLLTKKVRAVFKSDGLETLVVAREDSELPDGTPLDNITESGGVAISDFGEVAFHGVAIDPEVGSDKIKAVFTSDGLAALEGSTLEDDTILDDINENGGVAINLFGAVAFHGDAIVPDAFGDSVKAVLTQAGLIAKEGGNVDNGTTLDEIEVTGGVAINLFGDVAFHGRTGGVKAVFISDGETIQVVAKVGDNVDGTTLSEIHNTAGVAINPYGSEVAFHGRIGTTDAVFVGSAPDTGPNTPPVADFSFTTEDLTANFEDLSTDSDGEVVAWSWDFGDDTTSPLQNPSRTYSVAGTYDVTLTVTDSGGKESEPVIKPVEVTEPPPEDKVSVFVTSVGSQGDFGGLAEADAICQELATAAGLLGTWTAWLSDDNTDAIDRIPEPGPDGKYRLLDFNQTIVADNLADLTDGSLDAPINVDENGEELAPYQIWTGTKPDGTRTVSNCSNWTNADTPDSCTEGDPACGTRGKTTETSGEWTTDEFLSFCGSDLSFYCFSAGQ